MKDVMRFWPVFLFVAVTLVGGSVRLAFTTAASVQKHLDDDTRRDERIRVLERITVSEHPEYSATIYWDSGLR